MLAPSQTLRPKRPNIEPPQSTAVAAAASAAHPLAASFEHGNTANRRQAGNSSSNHNSNSRKNARPRRRRGKKDQQQRITAKADAHSASSERPPSSPGATRTGNDKDADGQNPPPKRNVNRRRNQRKKLSNTDSTCTSTAAASESLKQEQEDLNKVNPSQQQQQQQQSDKPSNNNNNTTKKKRRNKKNSKNKFAWRKQVPPDSVDPITLEPLVDLAYPPFAIVASPPYDPVPVWPVPEAAGTTTTKEPVSNRSTIEDTSSTATIREQRVLAEQWGSKVHEINSGGTDDDDDNDDCKKPSATASTENAPSTLPSPADQTSEYRHYHLYDGQALALWMTASNQFIDPLNRRDITRPELVNLDQYLQRHGFSSPSNNSNGKNQKLKSYSVTEAYDIKGVTISTAGAQGNTASGRAAILQQEASALLNALFGGNSVAVASAPTTSAETINNGNSNALMSQYHAYENSQQEQRQQSNSSNNNRRRRGQQHQERSNGNNVYEEDDVGIYGDMGGMLVIDDDMNPGLRGAAPEFVPINNGLNNDSNSSNSNTLWSASHIASRYSHTARMQDHEFPSLAAAPSNGPPTSAASFAKQATPKKRVLPKVNTLCKIATAVKKTDPKELQRQWEAREEARQRAMMSLGGFSTTSEIPSSITTSAFTGETHNSSSQASEAQLQRNRAFAEALGVAPATVRQHNNFSSGWARPAGTTGAAFDEFGAELSAAVYPDALIMRAKENMGLILKVEKRWKTFMADDTSASLSLNKMDKASRTLVHHYSDFWKLQTQSYDPEPNRYIHCSKLLDTAAPYPLLSEAVKTWKGPQAQQAPPPSGPQLAELSSPATAPEEGPAPPRDFSLAKSTEGRVPLSLKARSSSAGGAECLSPAPSSGQSIGGAPTRTMMNETETNERFASLLSTNQERPKLELQKRTLPTELPPYQPEIGGFDTAQVTQVQKDRRARQAQRDAEQREKERRILEQAFASDDESGTGNHKVDDHDDSSWEEQVPAFQGDDNE